MYGRNKLLFVMILLCISVAGYSQEVHGKLRSSKDQVLDSVHQVADRADTIKTLVNKPQEEIQKANTKLTSLQQRLQHRIDSATALPKPDTALVKKWQGMKSKVDSLKNKVPTSQALPGANTQLDKIQSATNGLESQVNGKLSMFQENGGLQETGNVQVPGLSAASLPGVQVPGLDLPDQALPSGVDVPKADVNLNAVSGVSAGKLDPLGNVNTGQVQNITGKLDDVSGDLNKLETGNVEEQIGKLDQMEGVQEQFAMADKAKRYHDPDVAKEEAMNKAKREAINHFAGHEEELKAAVEKMSKMKMKAPDKDALVDLFAKHPQSLKHKPFIERIFPGLNMQIQNQRSFWLDINPYVGYRINGRWQAGLGWNERLPYYFKRREWDRTERVYGLRSFVNFKLKDNLHIKAEAENMNAPTRFKGFRSGGEITGRQWVWSYFAGVKKDFQFSKSVKANVQILYTIYDPEKTSPYLNRFTIRIGFEFPLKKRKTDENHVNDQSR